MTEANQSNYWISGNALRITLNANGDADYIQGNTASGAMILCYIKGIEGLGYDAGHNYQRWKLLLSPTYFPSKSEKYVYVKIPRPSAKVPQDYAQVCFPSQKLDIYGKNASEQQIGSTDYYYIWLQGIISASEVGGVLQDRVWTQKVQTGTLASDEAYEAGGDGTWWKYSSVDDTVTFLKKIAHAVFERLRVTTRLIFGNSDESESYVSGVANSNTDETSAHDIVTPAYAKQKYLSREHDDTARGWITILQGIRTLEEFLEGEESGGALFTDSQERAQLVADVAKIRDKVLGSLNIEDALNIHGSSAQGNTFSDGTSISDYKLKVNGNTRIDNILVALAGIYANLLKSDNFNGDGPFDTGFLLEKYKGNARHSYLVVDELFVRMKAIFTELEIRKISYAGGNFIFSHAGSRIVSVKNITKTIAASVTGAILTISGPVNVTGQTLNVDGGATVSDTVATLTDNPVTYAYRCYFMKDDGTTATENWWRVNDQARCQTFNVTEPGTYHNIENTYYWRRVVNVGYEKVALTEGQSEQNYDFADLSVVDCDGGSDVPKAGDQIVQMGNRTDADRQGFVSLEVSGEYAPAFKVYKNVNSYTLEGKRKICLSPKFTELHLQKLVIETEYDAQPVPMERGPWPDIPGHRCYYYNLLQHNGSTWLCIFPESGGIDEDGEFKMYTTSEPREGAPYWQYYAKAGKDGKDGNSFNIVDTIDDVSDLPATGEEGQAYIVKIDGIGYLYVWSVEENKWKESGQIQGDPGRGISSVTISYGNSDSPSTLPTEWSSSPSPEQGTYLWTKTVFNYTDESTSEPSYSVSYNGADGTSPITIAVDNPIMSVACDKDGRATAAFSKTVIVSIYNGNEVVGLNSIDCTSATGISIQNKSAQNRSFKVVIAQGAYIDQANNLTATATATIDGDPVTRTIPITVNGIRQGADGLPASKVELSDYMVDIECDENSKAVDDFMEEITPKILADNKSLYITSISVGTHANVVTPSYYISPSRKGVISVSGKVATVNGVSTVSGKVVKLPSTVVRLPHIVAKVAKGGNVVDGNVSVNVTGVDDSGRVNTAGNYFAIVRNYYAPALQVVLSPEVLILTQDEQTKAINLSQAYTDVVLRIGGTDITTGLGITIEVSQVDGRPTCTASVSGNRVLITAINTTTASSGVYFDQGYVDIRVTYQGKVYKQRFSFYCNLLGTWREEVENSTKIEVAKAISYGYDSQHDPYSLETIGSFIKSNETNISTISSQIGDPSNPAAGTILKRMSTVEQTAGEIKLEVQGQTGVNLLNSPTDLCSSAAWERKCYLYKDVVYTVSVRFRGNGSVNGTLSGLMTNPPSPTTVSAGATQGAEKTSSTLFTCSKTGWYQLSFPASNVGTYLWAQLEQGNISPSNVVYHSANDYLSKTGIDIISGKITAVANNFEIWNSAKTTKTFSIDADGNLESSGNASFKGKITATSGSIGGFSIGEHKINSSNNKIILNDDGTATIGKMTVGASGNIVATDVDLTGKITSTSGTIGGFTIGSNKLYNTSFDASISITENQYANRQYSVKIGKEAINPYLQEVYASEYQCAMQIGMKNVGGTHNTGLYIDVEGSTVNYALMGKGNGVLEGLVCGYAVHQHNISSGGENQTMFPYQSSKVILTGNRSGNTNIGLPKLSHVRDILGISSTSTPFHLTIEVMNLSSTNNCLVCFRSLETGNTYNNAEYPYRMNWDNGHDINTRPQLGQGDYMRIKLMYYGGTYRAYLLENHN